VETAKKQWRERPREAELRKGEIGMDTLNWRQWVVLGLAVLTIFLTGKYAVFPALKELFAREQEGAKTRLEAKNEMR